MLAATLTILSALVLQDAPARERAHGVTFVLPKDWKRVGSGEDGSVALVPPDVGAGKVCSIVILPGDESESDASAWHASLWAAIAGEATTLEGGTPQTRSDVLETTARLLTKDGEKSWVILATLKPGARGQCFFFVSGTKALFDKHLPVFRAFVDGVEMPGRERPAADAAKAESPTGKPTAPSRQRPKAEPPAAGMVATGKPEAVSGIEIRRPKGWSRRERPDGGATFSPPDVPAGAACEVTVAGFETEDPDVSMHQSLWTTLTNGAEILGGSEREEQQLAWEGAGMHQIGYVTFYYRQTARIRRADGSEHWILLYTAKPRDRVEHLLFTATRFDQFARHRAIADDMFATAVFPDRPRLVRSGVAEVWGLTRRFMRPDPLAPTGSIAHIGQRYLVLYRNGAVYTGGPARGYDFLEVPDPADRHPMRMWTRWQEVSGGILLADDAGASISFRRDGDTLVSVKDPKDVFLRIPRVEAATLSATYETGVGSEGHTWIAFAADGTFKMRNIARLTGQSEWPVPFYAKEGRGTYRIVGWSLDLLFDDGVRFTLGLDCRGADPRDPAVIQLAGEELTRRR